MASPLLLLRADATARIGTGHVMRCLALAQAWQDRGGRTVFAAAELLPALRDRLSAEGCAAEPIAAQPGTAADAAETAALARKLRAEWVVLDGYHLGGDFQQSLKDAGLKVLVTDDYGHAGRYPADIILNQNLAATAEPYATRGSRASLLLGPHYALLRREFALYRGWDRQVPDIARRVLITLGGSDPDNISLKAVRALGQVSCDGLEGVVVVGADNPHRAEVEAAARACPRRVEVQADVTDMPALMAWADVAVAAGGTTSWERAMLRLPSLVLVLADNQIGVAAAYNAAGLGRSLGWHQNVSEALLAAELGRLLLDPVARSAMTRRSREAVDGLGGQRVVREMVGEPTVRLRAAQPEDARLVWEWANDPTVRLWSFNPGLIPWDDHARWFAGKLTDPACLFYVAAEECGVPVGQVRFDVTGRQAAVSVGLALSHRGCGFGIAILRAACQAILSERMVESVLALIRPGNVASIRAFQKAGFVPDGEDTVRGQPALRYLLTT